LALSGLSVLLVVTEPFAFLARSLIASRGGAPITLVVLSHPVVGRPALELDLIASDFIEAVQSWKSSSR
jgi:hypothetical protein